tara:strand:+ start:593 stop:775 length:183 start_codon:yes stop_codon:yes gene_type:complete
MCLGGGGGSTPQPKYLARVDPEPGPASPADAVNNQVIEGTEPKKKKLEVKKGKAQSSLYT